MASKENMPKARSVVFGDSLSHCPDGSHYDLIISNPPIHTEKQEQFMTLHNLIKTTPEYLQPGGKLILVVQARIPLEDVFEKSFNHYSILMETTRFKVWQAQVL